MAYVVRIAALVCALHAVSVLAEVLPSIPGDSTGSPRPADRQVLVREFVDAFNRQDSAGMARMVSDDVEWLSIDGQKIAVETQGKAQLVRSMDAYFKSCPSCRSELQGILATSQRATAIEVARWQSARGPRMQRGVVVYEFDGALIRRVVYFPAEP